MKGTILIQDTETGKILEEIGTVIYDNASRAIQNAEYWYAEELAFWADQNYQPEILLVDCK